MKKTLGMNMNVERIRSWFLEVAGYLVPLLQPVPSMGIWIGVMVLPLISFLIMEFLSLPISLVYFFSVFFVPISVLFRNSGLLFERVFILVGFLLLVYSMAYLRIKRKEGLVTSGPYRLVRHPQYLGIVLLTIGFTSGSYWYLTSFGNTYLDPLEAVGVWFIELFAYILLAYIEELYLSRKYGESFENYKSRVPLFIPFLKTKRKGFDILVSILIPAILLSVRIISNPPFPFPFNSR